MDRQKLAKEALRMRQFSYAPYSGFCVGAALLTREGEIYTGCNIENAAFTPTNCAERTAIFKAVSEGHREFTAIAVAGGRKEEEEPLSICTPCGVCRQVMMEFCDPETFEIILIRSKDDFQVVLLKDLLPMGFGAGNL